MSTNGERFKYSIFAERFGVLRGKRTQADFASFLEISRPTVGFYENGERTPDVVVLTRICKKCNVSANWLLGLSEYANPESEQITAAELGLTEKAIGVLKYLKAEAVDPWNSGYDNSILSFINLLIESELPEPIIKGGSVGKGIKELTGEERKALDEWIVAQEKASATWRAEHSPVITALVDYLRLQDNGKKYIVTEKDEIYEENDSRLEDESFDPGDSLYNIAIYEIKKPMLLRQIEDALEHLREIRDKKRGDSDGKH